MSRILSTGLVAFCLAVSSAGAAEELLPPFGFRWNDSMARVDAVLHGAKAKIVSREKKDNREVWTVEGLVHPGLRRTLFSFKERSLLGYQWMVGGTMLELFYFSAQHDALVYRTITVDYKAL